MCICSVAVDRRVTLQQFCFYRHQQSALGDVQEPTAAIAAPPVDESVSCAVSAAVNQPPAARGSSSSKCRQQQDCGRSGLQRIWTAADLDCSGSRQGRALWWRTAVIAQGDGNAGRRKDGSVRHIDSRPCEFASSVCEETRASPRCLRASPSGDAQIPSPPCSAGRVEPALPTLQNGLFSSPRLFLTDLKPAV
ncbi:hypothetical protein COCON_G00160570 [Conger conger]|uniref:Uncharacterized protein n=1 Tax=Conger conger TaxID=82655 RepID=A0A9Q1DAN1_CONCO|nr:hypothetical protein COCON_G00160570 [Conger conger]